MTYGPMRTASAICWGVASCRAGTCAPVTMPPWPTSWWQPAQWSANRRWPSLSDPLAGSTRGIAGPPYEPMYATRSAIWPLEYAGSERTGWSPIAASGMRPVDR